MIIDSTGITLTKIKRRLVEIDIEINSLKGDEEYDLTELYQEQEDLENAIANGEYLDYDFE